MIPYSKYKIKGWNIKERYIGTIESPHLYYISPGKYNDSSLIFFVKIFNIFHELHLVKVNRTSCNFECVHKSCTATHKMRISPNLIIATPGAYKMNNGKSRTKYDIDRTDDRVKDIANWTVIPHNSKFPHKTAQCKREFLASIGSE